MYPLYSYFFKSSSSVRKYVDFITRSCSNSKFSVDDAGVYQSVNSTAFLGRYVHATTAALVVPAAYYSTRSSDSGMYTLK